VKIYRLFRKEETIGLIKVGEHRRKRLGDESPGKKIEKDK
jgi:hypothetical protein